MKIFSLLLPLISSQYYPPMGPGMAGGFRPNQRNAYIPENGVMRKVSMNEHHGKPFFHVKYALLHHKWTAQNSTMT